MQFYFNFAFLLFCLEGLGKEDEVQFSPINNSEPGPAIKDFIYL